MHFLGSSSLERVLLLPAEETLCFLKYWEGGGIIPSGDWSHLTRIYWASVRCQHCAKMLYSWGCAKQVSSCWLTKYPCKLQTYLPECLPWSHSESFPSPFFSEVNTYPPSVERPWSACFLCLCDKRQSHLSKKKIYLKGSDVIISNLKLLLI